MILFHCIALHIINKCAFIFDKKETIGFIVNFNHRNHLYRKSRNKVTSTLHRLKTEYIKNSVKRNSGDSGKIWKTLRCVIPNKRGDTSIHSIKVEGVDIQDDMKLANSFNEYFTNIVGRLKKNCKFGGNF